MRDRRAGGSLFVVGVKAAALHHKAAYHAVKYQSVVMFVFDILEKIGDCFRRDGRVQLDHKITLARDELDLGGGLGVGDAYMEGCTGHHSCHSSAARR